MRLDNVRLLVTRYEECVLFYRDVLGLKRTWGDTDTGYASFSAGNGAKLALFGRKAMAEAISAGALPEKTEARDAFACIFEVEDLEQTVKSLEAKGVRIVAPVQDRPHWGIRTAHLRDPDGNLIELYEGLPKEKWSPELVDMNKKYA